MVSRALARPSPPLAWPVVVGGAPHCRAAKDLAAPATCKRDLAARGTRGFAGGARMETSRCCRPARVVASLSAIGCAARPQPFCCRLTQRVPLPCSLQAHISMGDIDLLHPPKELEQQRHKLKRLVQTPNSFFMDVKCPGCFNMCAYTPTRRHTCPMSCGSAHAATTHAAAQRRAVSCLC